MAMNYHRRVTRVRSAVNHSDGTWMESVGDRKEEVLCLSPFTVECCNGIFYRMYSA